MAGTSPSAPEVPGRRRRGAAHDLVCIGVGAGLGLAAAAGVAGGLRPAPIESKALVVPREVATVVLDPVDHAEALVLDGWLEPRARAVLAFRVPGRIASVLVEEGARVRAGDLLATLDRAELAEMQKAAAAELRSAKPELDRARTLAARSATTAAELDRAEARYEAAAARVRRAELDLAETRLLAPFSGVVAHRPLEAGSAVTPHEPVLELVDLSTVEARVGVPQALLGAMAEGRPVTVEIADRRIPARVRSLAPGADPATRTFPARIPIPNPDAALRAGTPVKVRAEATARATLVVPAAALVPSPAGALSVFVVEGGRARRRAVKARWLDDGRVALAAGVGAGERVVTGGAAWLRDGAPVRESGRP